MPANIKRLLRELKQGLVRIYGERLKAVILYGSYARGDYDTESDIDVLVVLKDYKQYGREIDRTGELICSMSLDYGVTVSPIFMRDRDWVKGEKPLLRNVQAEGVRI
ncbi:MAG: nucleotidyltransferase domain-containing protein [Anaerolineales bacterium]|nr:nucleotidyltransferase domain-containing protein [Anaerolineales bacterium]